jgi:MFS family permease
LFGRRWFIISGNIFVFIGSIVGGSAKTTTAAIVAQALLGWGSGNCELAAFALPELLPNKWRHFAVVISDAVVIFTVLIGPVAARVAIAHGDAVR